MDPVQKAVMNHTFGAPLIRTKRAVISCNVCQIRFNSESQAEAHYKGNRHARRVRGIETSKSRPRENDKPLLLPAPAPPSTSNLGESEASRVDDQPLPQMEVSTPAPPPVPESPVLLPPCSLLPLPVPGGALISSLSSLGGSAGARTPRADPAGVPNGSPLTPTPESEEDKAKKLLYCSLCKVAVNSLSQLEAHNKGTKHKTILEARSGLGPIKVYPRLDPRLAPEQGGSPADPSTQERTFHCEICNVRVNSEGQLKQGGSPADPSTQERTFHCEICNVRVNSEGQLKQHISSRRHRDGVAGKPNTLLNRGKKQRTGDLASTLSFSKDLPKSLGAGLLPSPLAIAAAMAAATSSSSLALRAAVAGHAHHPSHHHHLLQGPPLSHTLLRPAPGPIRTSHGPIIFSPY
ncbi:UNVERIFIED_CONTAM: hypothetical protein FKN15_008852 [Acipenser sinensis]